MVSDRKVLQTLDQLRDYVYETLCQLNELERDVFEMTERILFRAQQPCGSLFCLYGPRQVRLTAIWETDTSTIRFYDSGGERVQTVPIKGTIELEPSSALTTFQ